jgi:hypothetical protein
MRHHFTHTLLQTVRRPARIGMVLTAAAVASGGIAGPAAGHPDASQAKRSKTERELRAVRAATSKYHSTRRARQDGFVRPPGPVSRTCVDGKGVHFDHPRRMRDTKLDIRRPDILVYEPGRGGKLHLVAVEYFKEDADQNLGTDDDRPKLFRRSFQGPMPAHHPGMGVHYDLHVWLYKRNPKGRFAPDNPRVDCG